MINIVVAVDLNSGIGKDNKLLWHLPNDMLHFKTLTENHTVVMGRKTYESIGRPLPNRTNVVLTRDVEYLRDNEPEDVYVYNSFFYLMDDIEMNGTDEEIFIIGGEEIYKLFLPHADKVYMTMVFETFDADTFFPDLGLDDWIPQSIEMFSHDEKNPYDHAIAVFAREMI